MLQAISNWLIFLWGLRGLRGCTKRERWFVFCGKCVRVSVFAKKKIIFQIWDCRNEKQITVFEKPPHTKEQSLVNAVKSSHFLYLQTLSLHSSFSNYHRIFFQTTSCQRTQRRRPITIYNINHNGKRVSVCRYHGEREEKKEKEEEQDIRKWQTQTIQTKALHSIARYHWRQRSLRRRLFGCLLQNQIQSLYHFVLSLHSGHFIYISHWQSHQSLVYKKCFS